MLTRVLFVLVLIGGLPALPALAGETRVLGLGVTDHVVAEAEVSGGSALPAPRFNTPGVAYVLVGDAKAGDEVELSLNKDGKSLMHNVETVAEDKPTVLLLAGKTGVPAGGWPEGAYSAAVKVTRDGKTLIEQESKPVPFE
jgi:hypothetical protein